MHLKQCFRQLNRLDASRSVWVEEDYVDPIGGLECIWCMNDGSERDSTRSSGFLTMV
jgi:hypothetical protein